jgi:hypothetical protein
MKMRDYGSASSGSYRLLKSGIKHKGKAMTIVRLEMAAFIFLTICGPLLAATSGNIGDLQVFPINNPWNWDISAYAVHPNSDNYVASIGAAEYLHPDFGTVWDGAPSGIPYVVVNGGQPQIPIVYTAYGDESDSGPFPVPLDAPVEGGPAAAGDRHVLAVDTTNRMLYELYRAFPQTSTWNAACGAKYDMTSNNLRPETWTSADAAGLPIFPGLVRYEEVYMQQVIDHALRFTVVNSQKKYIWPARHYASSSIDPNRPPMGLRFRLKAGFNISGFSAPVQVILRALKKYGMLMADNGSNWYISGAPDDRWDDDVLSELKDIAGSNFEAILTVDTSGAPIYPTGIGLADPDGAAAAAKIDVQPNPFLRIVTIGNCGDARCIKVTDLNGREVAVIPVLGAEAIWDGRGQNCRKVAPGIYLLKVPGLKSIITRLIVAL